MSDVRRTLYRRRPYAVGVTTELCASVKEEIRDDENDCRNAKNPAQEILAHDDLRLRVKLDKSSLATAGIQPDTTANPCRRLAPVVLAAGVLNHADPCDGMPSSSIECVSLFGPPVFARSASFT